VLAALSTLAFPVALKVLIDQGLVAADPGERVMALREHFLALFAVARRWACSRPRASTW
jgi:ATP-binding cassette subfamily B protein